MFNPKAGRGRGREVAAAAQRHLRAAGWDASGVETEGPGHATELARERGGEVDLFVIVGGDGTLREAVEGLNGARPDLGFVPMGNANVVARELRIPLDPAAAIECLTTGAPRRLDVARANGSAMLAMVGIGYDAIVTRWVHRARESRALGGWYRVHADSLYGAVGLVSLFDPLPRRFRLEVDGVACPHRYCTAVLANVETYAKGWAMAPGADPADGALDFHARKRSAAPFGLWSMWSASQHRRVPRFVSDYGRGRRFRLQAERPFRWQLDGDPMGEARELVVEVDGASVRLVAPRAPRDCAPVAPRADT